MIVLARPFSADRAQPPVETFPPITTRVLSSSFIFFLSFFLFFLIWGPRAIHSVSRSNRSFSRIGTIWQEGRSVSYHNSRTNLHAIDKVFRYANGSIVSLHGRSENCRRIRTVFTRVRFLTALFAPFAKTVPRLVERVNSREKKCHRIGGWSCALSRAVHENSSLLPIEST